MIRPRVLSRVALPGLLALGLVGCHSASVVSGQLSLSHGTRLELRAGGDDYDVVFENLGPDAVEVTRDGGWFGEDVDVHMSAGDERTFATEKITTFALRIDREASSTVKVTTQQRAGG